MRTKIVKALLAIGVNVQDNHGFIPHSSREPTCPLELRSPRHPTATPYTSASCLCWALGGRIRVPMGLPDEESNGQLVSYPMKRWVEHSFN